MPTHSFEQVFTEAVKHKQAGRLPEAAEAWRRCADLAPDRPDILYNLGNTLKELDCIEDAVSAYRQAIALAPGFGDAHYNLASVLKAMGRLKEALDSYRAAIAVNPNDVEAHMNLGNTLDELGNADAAEEALRQAVKVNPNLAAAHFNLANVNRKAGRKAEAEDGFRRALSLEPTLVQAHIGLGRSLMERGDLASAIDHFNRAIQIDPESSAAHLLLGSIYRKMDRLPVAEENCLRALTIDPDMVAAHDLLGNIRMGQGRIAEAADSFRRAITFDPELPQPRTNLGNALTDLRDLAGATESYSAAIRLAADGHGEQDSLGIACRTYLMNLLYLPGLTNEELFRRYKETVAKGFPSPETKTDPLSATPRKAGERLRIGYVSSDFRNHPIGFNVLPLLANHNKDRFEVFCYSCTVQINPVTEIIRGHADHWRDINGLTEKEIASTIRADAVDVAVFLGGHFDNNQPGAAAYRAAPAQVAMHGGATTAQTGMDYWLTDPILHPKAEFGGDAAEGFTETLWRLPNFYAFTPPENAPEVSALPADENGYVTFVSFNKPCKMNNSVLDLWSRVLNAVPGSRLVLKNRNHLDDAAVAGPILERFAANGIDAERISLIAAMDSQKKHLAHYHRGDIALDTFPFSGATTTFQALWMGVPVVSWYGERFIGRMGASICHHAGLGGLACATPEEYINTAAALAEDQDRLRQFRAELRGQVEASPLLDGKAYARNVEDALFAMHDATASI